MENARNAALSDPRFPPVSPGELSSIKVEVSVLTKPTLLPYRDPEDLLQKLVPGIDGVILEQGPYQSTFLPQVWGQLPDKVQFLEHLSLKGGMPRDGWKTRRSSVTVRNISANSSLRFMFITGSVAATVQILFLREFLSVFSGNELVIGLIFGLWLLSAAAGSRMGSRADFAGVPRFAFIAIISVVAGFLILRAVRLLYHPGELIPPVHILFIVLPTQSFAAWSGGWVFGRLSRIIDGAKLYRAESAGAAARFLGVSLCILRGLSNGAICAGALGLLAIAAYSLKTFAPSQERRGSLGYLIASLFVTAGLVALNPLSMRWKYACAIDGIIDGYEGEIATGRGEGGPITLLNNTVYRADIPLPSIEQAVHVPASMHRGALHRALVIGNPGYLQELGNTQICK